MGILFYPSKIYNGTKEYPYRPELITWRVMLNPKYRIKHLARGVRCIVDSGAFQDIDAAVRLTPAQALDRQLKYREYLIGITQDPLFNYEAVCIYDQMAGVDEHLTCLDDCYIEYMYYVSSGTLHELGLKKGEIKEILSKFKKIKARGTEETATNAVAETLRAAEYYASQRDEIRTKVVWIAQGINANQYTNDCTIPLMDFVQKGDYFGFGGFCIIGKQRKTMLPIFYETVDKVLPVLKKKGIGRAHLLGVMVPEAVKFFVQECRKYNIVSSTDGSAPEVAGVAFGKTYSKEGKQLAPEQIKKIYNRDTWIKWEDYNPIKLAMANVRRYELWSSSL